ncbi:MAG: hypothetical protein IPM51_11890 [Sphingobacteriaceae bacterium]|nr:hypothetical protein [Sphingobacteriaceae bacterium]
MLKNVAGQNISAQLINKTDGSDVTTGTTTVYVTKDNGTQTSGGGTVTNKGNGEWNYAPTQAETNANYIKFTFVNTSAITAGIGVYTISFNPHDTVRLGLTSLPNAAADAAGGLAISDAGGLDLDTLLGRLDAAITTRMATYTQPTGFLAATFPTTIASPTNITGGTITTVTNLTNLPSIPANWITAAGIAASALNNKGNWNIGKTGYSISGTKTTLDDLNDVSVSAVADAVWDELISGHLTAGTTGASLNAAGGSGDPWVTSLPGSYTSGQAGYIIGTYLNATISSRSSHTAANVRTEIDANSSQLAAILADTAVIGTAGAGLTAIPWNSAWDAEVQSECTDALNAYDPPTNAELASGINLLGGYIDTEINSILTIINKLDTALELDGAVYRFTTNALELAPSGGGGGGDATLANQTAILAALTTIDSIVDAILVDTDTTIPATLNTIAGYIDTEVTSIVNSLVEIKGTGFDTDDHSLVVIASAGGSLTVSQASQLSSIYAAVNSKPVIQSDLDENPTGSIITLTTGDTYGENFNPAKSWTVDYGVDLTGAVVTFTAANKQTKQIILQKTITQVVVSGTKYTLPLTLTTAEAKLFKKSDDIIFDIRIVSGTDVDHSIIGSIKVIDVVNLG